MAHIFSLARICAVRKAPSVLKARRTETAIFCWRVLEVRKTTWRPVARPWARAGKRAGGGFAGAGGRFGKEVIAGVEGLADCVNHKFLARAGAAW